MAKDKRTRGSAWRTWLTLGGGCLCLSAACSVYDEALVEAAEQAQGTTTGTTGSVIDRDAANGGADVRSSSSSGSTGAGRDASLDSRTTGSNTGSTSGSVTSSATSSANSTGTGTVTASGSTASAGTGITTGTSAGITTGSTGTGGGGESSDGSAGIDARPPADAASDARPLDAAVDATDAPAPTCTDGKLNGAETAIDCGGGTCPRCASGAVCAVNADCNTGLCSSLRCVVQRTCALIKSGDPTAPDGSYPVDPDGVNTGAGPFNAYCDMTAQGGGWTRVGYEPAGAGGNQVMGALALLGAYVGTTANVLNKTGPALIGRLFNAQYKELRVNWGTDYARMTVPEDIFVDTVRTSIAVTNFTTTNAMFSGWVTAAGSAVFCRAATTTAGPGDTSWAIKPADSTNVDCGCSGNAWDGQGVFYGGILPPTVCSPWGGGFAGVCAAAAPKGGIVSAASLELWVK